MAGKKGCGDCSNESRQARTYIDDYTGVLCAEICEKYEKPDSLVIVPFICTSCGTTTWKTIDNRLNSERKK